MQGHIGNKYTLLEKLAVGGMAEIFLAERRGPGGFSRRLVIKRILEHLVSDPKFLQMFQDEARLAAGLNHPNIVQIFELDQDEGSYYIAMEYIKGYNLRAVIQNCNEHSMWLAPEYIAKLGSQICEGLEYAHNFCDSSGNHMNIIHRDVSPQNIILSHQGVVKIVDFGIAKAASNKVETQAGVIKGKLAYMSPEQVKGQKLDRRSDLFSLGIVLYELATHQRPFQGKSDLDILRAILESKPQQIGALRPEFPQELNQIIYRALAKNREDRYSSARDLQWDLERFIQGWGKPIGPFQLQQLVTKLEELTGQQQPAAQPPAPQQPVTPQPTPAPTYPPQDAMAGYGYDDDEEEDTIYSKGGLANNVGPSYNDTPTPPAHNWYGDENDEWEEEHTVLQPSPVSPSAFPAPRQVTSSTDDDLMTIHEPGHKLSPPPGMSASGPSTILDSQLPPGILDPLKPVGKPNPSAPTVLDRPLPQIPPPSYQPASAPPSSAIAKPQIPHPNGNGVHTKEPQQLSSQVTVDARAFGHDVVFKTPKKSKGPLIALLSFVVIAGLSVGAYFLFFH